MATRFSCPSYAVFVQFRNIRKPSLVKPQALARICHRLPPRYRFRFCTRCSVTDIDVNIDLGVTNEILRDIDETDNLEPIVHLNTEIISSGSLGLLTEAADAESILTSLRVLSGDERKVIASTPAHAAGLYALYANTFFGNLVEQLWNFAWPSAIALLYPSLLPVAVIGFFSKVAIIIGGPLVGKIMDSAPKISVFISLNIVQVAAQFLSALMIIQASTVTPTPSSSILSRPWFIILVIAASIERLCGIASGVATERDWVVLLAGINRPIALAKANAVLSRIDLICETAGASVFGILLSRYDLVTCLKLAAVLIASSLPVMIALSLLTNKLSGGVLEQSRLSQPLGSESAVEDNSRFVNIVDKSIETIKLGWKEYLQQPVLPASLAFVVGFFNVALAPGSLMTAYLTQLGVNHSIIGGFSGLCSSMGIAATFLSSLLIRHLGILQAGAAGLIFQATLLAIAVAVYMSGSLATQTSLNFFLGIIVLSRLGQMSYNVIGQQILQTGIPSAKANLIGATEVSVASIAESLMLGIAVLANDVSQFGLLAVLSLASVTGAAWLFCSWQLNRQALSINADDFSVTC